MTHNKLGGTERIIVLDFGSQYTQLIARRIRSCGVYSEILPYNTSLSEVLARKPRGLILSGGPASVLDDNAPLPNSKVLTLGIPVLGICYGMQVMASLLGGMVSNGVKREYGKVRIFVDESDVLFEGVPRDFVCWMSHADQVTTLPKGFVKTAHTNNTMISAMTNKARNLYGVQFHPEVFHTEHGTKILDNFVKKVCDCKSEWRLPFFVEETVRRVRKTVKGGKVVLALSGGVDSFVTGVLLEKAVGSDLHCVFVDNGLLREENVEEVKSVFDKYFTNLHYVNARTRFLKKLRGVVDPEEKRRVIGEEFVNVFEEVAKSIGGVEFLAQGTIYPDVIESCSVFGGPSSRIKTHHNVGGLPERMRLKLIEPLRFLFKDEVRRVGELLGIPRKVLYKHPFPGPGFAIRIIGEVTMEKLELLKRADSIVLEEVRKHGFYDKVWQAFAVLLGERSVGVMGDGRSYERVLAVRIVNSVDGMTADWVRVPYELLEAISSRVVNEVKGVSRVVYDISSKPPATIEWE